MSKAIPTMFHVVSRAMARAIREGRPCDKGILYGVFATSAKAFRFQEEYHLRMVSEVIEK